MGAAAKPANEAARLAALRQYRLLDTPPEQIFDDTAALASAICRTPIAAMVLIDGERQWLKAKVGVAIDETPREHAFCAHTVLGDELLVVEDARADARFADNPYVTADPAVRFYAGAPLVNPGGFALGALCVVDTEPRRLDPDQRRALGTLARQVVGQMELRRVAAELADALAHVRTLGGLLPMCAWCKSVRNDAGYWGRVEEYIREQTGAKLTHGMCPDCETRHAPLD